MHPPTRALLMATILSLDAQRAPAAVPTGADVSRTIAMVFAGNPGTAGGDVTADGRATAADVVSTILGLRSPTQRGPYGIGLRRMIFTKRSETHPDQDRPLLTDIWYPAPPGVWPTDRRPGGSLNAPLADGLAHLPLVMFSHGSCGFQEQSVYLVTTLASYGFIVAAPPHPGNSTAEIITCSTPDALADSFVNRPSDISFVIDALLALNADPASFFFGVIDPARIGMSGHSYGGLTTLRVSAMDARVVAGLALAPVVQAIGPAIPSIEDEVASIRIPVMIQVGSLDGLLGHARVGYDLLQPPRFLLEIASMTHSPFSDFCTECGPGTIPADEAHLFILRYAVPYLFHWVAGDARFDAFLAPSVTPPGVTYTADLGV